MLQNRVETAAEPIFASLLYLSLSVCFPIKAQKGRAHGYARYTEPPNPHATKYATFDR